MGERNPFYRKKHTKEALELNRKAHIKDSVERYSLDMKEAAEDIERAVEEVLKDGYRTADIYAEGMKKVGTKEMGQLVVSKL